MTHTARATDIDLLIDLLRRSPLLEALRDGAFDRRELQDRLGVSRSTSHRHTRLLADLGVVERVDGAFRLTESGALLTETMVRFKREASSALQLAPVLDAVGDAPVALDPDALVGATVTSTERGDPYSPVARFIALVRETETLRGIDLDAIAPLYVEEVLGCIVDGMETEDVTQPEAVDDTLARDPENCMKACASGYLTVKLHDDLPFALAIFDERVGIGVTEPNSRSLRVFVDTDAPPVHEWAEAVYAAYDAEAVALDEFTRPGFREAMRARAEHHG